MSPDRPPSRVGISFQSDKRAKDYERLGAAAEHYGFDVASVYGDLFFPPPLAPLLAMARATSSIVLGPACLNPFTVHPVEIAGQVAALDEASGGRAFLGLARGAWLDQLGGDQGPVEAVAEAAAIVSALLAGDRRGVAGRSFQLAPGAGLHYSPVRPSVPLMIGTWGPRLARLAGGTADEVKVGGSANPKMVPVVAGWSAQGALAAGRAQAVGTVLGAVTVVDHDGAAARARARREVAMYIDVVGHLDPTLDIPAEVARGIRDALRGQGPEAAGRHVPDELLACFAFAGTPPQVAAQAALVLAAGASRVDFGTPHGLSDDEGVRLLGSAVLPAIREAVAA